MIQVWFETSHKCIFSQVNIKEQVHIHQYFGCLTKNVPTKVKTKPKPLPTRSLTNAMK